MKDYIILLYLAIAGCIIFSLLYVFSGFSYEIVEGKLSIKWTVLKYIPFGSKRVPISSIQDVRRFEFKKDILRGAYIGGNLFIKDGVLLILKEGVFKRVYITPDNPDDFIVNMKHRMATRG